jgi:hypothetical protein
MHNFLRNSTVNWPHTANLLVTNQHQQHQQSQLKRAVEAVLSRPGAQRPERARFFRGQMQTIITKALTECQIKPIPSRRCFTVMCECVGFLCRIAAQERACKPGTTHARTHACVRVCMCVCVFVCMHVCELSACVCAIYACMHACVRANVCMCV